MASIDPGTIIGAIILAASNLGAAKILLSRSLDKIDQMDRQQRDHAVILERTVQTQNTTVENLQHIQESIKELYDSRNSQNDNLVEINTLHELKRCKDI